jgi:hypothetical protein
MGQQTSASIHSLGQDRVFRVEDWLQKANDHETTVVDLAPKRNLFFREAKLVCGRKIGISSSHDTIVVNNNQLFVGNLRLGVLEDAISVDVPRVTDIVVVKDAFLVRHDHILVRIHDVNNAKLVRRHDRGREFVSSGKAVSFDDNDFVGRSRYSARVGNVSSIHLKRVKPKELFKLGRHIVAVSGRDVINTDTRFV